MNMRLGGSCFEKERELLDVTNPVTGDVVGSVPAMIEEDIDLAVEAAAEGQRQWAEKSPMERGRILRKFVELMNEEKEELSMLLCRENGKRLGEAVEEFDTVGILIDSYCEKASHMYGDCFPNGTDPTTDNSDIIFTRREPLGVAACFLPFNFPVELCGHKIAPALAAGNAVIVKPPTDCPLAVIRLMDCLRRAGVPEKAAQVVTGSGARIGGYLAGHPGIQAVTMTGSTETGIGIARAAAANLTRTFLELGGNDAFIIMGDADLDLAVDHALESRVVNAGQVCCASKRYLVHESVTKTFTAKLIEALKKLKIGDPMDKNTDVGSMISAKAADEVAGQIKKTVEQGAVCVYGGGRPGAAFLEPAVLTGVTGEMDIAKDMEVFGPVFPIISFRTAAEAVSLANQSSFGLNGAVFSQNMTQALRIAGKLQTGSVVINGGGNYRTSTMPFGGYKKSGIGREGSSATLEEMTQVKSYVLKDVIGAV